MLEILKEILKGILKGTSKSPKLKTKAEKILIGIIF